MNHIHVKKFGFAVGATSGLLYLGCALLMLIIGRDGTARFFGTLIHGLDVSGIIRMDMPAVDAVSGVIQSFILGWLIGASVAAIYNASIGETFERPSNSR